MCSFLNYILHLSPDLNLGFVIRHNITCTGFPITSSTTFIAENVINFTSVKLARVYLTDLMNTLMMLTSLLPNILIVSTIRINSDMKVGAISPISCGSDDGKSIKKDGKSITILKLEFTFPCDKGPSLETLDLAFHWLIGW